MLKNKLFTNRKFKRISSFCPQSIHLWKSCWWKPYFHHQPHTASSNSAWLLSKHRSRPTRWLTLEANSPPKEIPLPSRKDLTWPHCHLQTDIQTGNKEVNLHSQKLSYTVKTKRTPSICGNPNKACLSASKISYKSTQQSQEQNSVYCETMWLQGQEWPYETKCHTLFQIAQL